MMRQKSSDWAYTIGGSAREKLPGTDALRRKIKQGWRARQGRRQGRPLKLNFAV